jgi:hypothetical protein
MNNTEAKVIDLQAFRTRRTLVGERKTGVQQAFKPTSQAPSRSSQGTAKVNEADLSTRIERIKSSISRINQLMAELRSMSNDDKTAKKDPL